MIIYRLLTMISLTVLHTMTENLFITRDNIDVNVGKRVRLDCELNDTIINSNRKGLWLRLEDAEVFFYSTSRINSDHRFQIEQRTNLHIINNTYTSEILTYSLIINDVRLSDNGTYSCQSDNKIVKLFLLNIVERPYFITHEYSTLVRTRVGKNLSINCQALGKPAPSLSWIKKIDENNQKLMINCSILSSSCQLSLFNITRRDNGIYECVAMNNIGTIGRFYEVDVQFPPEVYFLTKQSSYFIGDTVILECLINSNPEPDIGWLHRFSDDSNQEIDLSRQYLQENGRKIWYIENEQLNSTIWKTSLFIKHIPRRLFNSSFICRGRNRHGENEQSINISEKHHSSKKHRHTTSSSLIYISTVSYNQHEKQLSSSTEPLSEQINKINNRSRRISPYLYYLFILEFYSFLSFFYV